MGVSACLHCTFAKNQTCSSDADCVYDGCRHPETPQKAEAGSTVKCFTSSDNEIIMKLLDTNGNQLVASQCYALHAYEYDNFAACPAKDAVTSPVGSSAMLNCEGFCPEGEEYVKEGKTCQLCPVVFSFVHALCAMRCMIRSWQALFGIHLL